MNDVSSVQQCIIVPVNLSYTDVLIAFFCDNDIPFRFKFLPSDLFQNKENEK